MLTFAVTVWAGDFEDGVAAYDRKDYTTALIKFKSAAEQGHVSSQANIGVMYYRGEGVPQDFLRAQMWFNLAAAGGEANAIKNRDIGSARMTVKQLRRAQRMAKRCKARNYKRC